MGRHAFLVNTRLDEPHRTANILEYAVQLAEADNDVQVYFDGAATQWPGAMRRDPDNPVVQQYRRAVDAGVIAGVCGKCAVAFGTTEDAKAAGAPLLGDGEYHQPDAGELSEEGYELHVV